MPANLPPQYFEAEKRYRLAKDPEEKIGALQAMLAIMPKHKGTDKLHAELRRKIAKLSDEAERKYATARRAGLYIGREGAGQVILVGLANVGKSQLLASVTEASPEIAPYPYTTKTAVPGMMKFEDIQIQLVDTPPIGDKHVRILLTNSLRGADLIAIVVDLSAEPAAQVEATLQALREARIEPLSANPEEAIPDSYQKKMLIIGNKSDLAGASAKWAELMSRYSGFLAMVSTSAKEGKGLDKLKESIYKALDIVRVYTKAPGSKADLTEPVILRKGSTAMDAAESIHKDFQQNLKYVVVWGSGKYDGQRVSRDHALQDGDVVEFHV
jgi:ribosome-interacting GTPase 1